MPGDGMIWLMMHDAVYEPNFKLVIEKYSFQTMREHGWEKGRQTWHINMKQQCGRVIFHHGNIILFIECNK